MGGDQVLSHANEMSSSRIGASGFTAIGGTIPPTVYIETLQVNIKALPLKQLATEDPRSHASESTGDL